MPTTSTRAIAIAALVLSAGGLSACGSSNGARCPDPEGPGGGPAACEPCPACPAAPAAGPAVIKIAADTLRLDRPRRIALSALSEDGTRALLRVEDSAVGTFFQNVLLVNPDGTPVPKVDKVSMFDRASETSVRAQALKGFKAHPGPPSSVDARGVTLVGAERGTAVTVFAMMGERAVPIVELPRLSDADGRPSDVQVAKLAWDPTGKRVIIIHRQALSADLGFASDFIHVVPVDARALPF